MKMKADRSEEREEIRLYSSDEIWIGKIVKGAPVVYIHPEKRFFAVERTIDVYEGCGVRKTERFHECYQMVQPEKLASSLGRGGFQLRKDYDDV